MNVSGSSWQKKPSPSKLKSLIVIGVKIAVLVALVLLIANSATSYLAGSKRSGAEKKADRAVPVNVATAQLSEVPIEIRSIGNVTPYSVVNITPQVSGQLSKVHFTQGQLVRKGELLFEIDPRPYRASLDQAEGNVARDRAQIKAAQANLAKDEAQIGQLEANLNRDNAQLSYASRQKARYQELVQQGAVSHEQSDQMNTSETQALATLQADRMAIENAKAVVRSDAAQIETALGTLRANEGAAENARIQLSWTKIRSPIDGRTSSLNVYEGNVVTANSTAPIVTIAQVKPIYVTVTVPEQYLNDVRRAHQAGSLKLVALIGGSKTDSVNGAISFMENTVNTTTGTIMLRASFGNVDEHLYPGQFVDVVLRMPPAGSSVVVPSRAVQATQQGRSVYVVKNGKAELTPVKVGQTFAESSSIISGLSAGDVVVIDGQLQLTPGAKVRVQPTRADEPGS
jgi:multidrug efflux system membrane fusion protein